MASSTMAEGWKRVRDTQVLEGTALQVTTRARTGTGWQKNIGVNIRDGSQSEFSFPEPFGGTKLSKTIAVLGRRVLAKVVAQPLRIWHPWQIV